MVASTHWLGTATGQAVLERGGNAFDAAVACAFVLQVVEPHLNGPGGDLVGIFCTSEKPSEPIVLMGQGPAPARATIEHYRSEGLSSVPGAGALAAAVPGATDAWLLLLRDYGTWELADVLKFAIEYSRSGFPILDRVVATIEKVAQLFSESWTSSADLWLPGGRAPARGSYFRNLPLARTFERLARAAKGSSRESRIDAARSEWSEGFVAESAEKFLAQPHRHSNGADLPGVVTAADFAAFRAQFETPICANFRGITIAKAGAWSQGPALLEMLGILDGFGNHELDPATPSGTHNILEAEKLALADRESYFGDSNQDALAELLSPEFIASRRALIGAEASREFRPGILSTQLPFIPPLDLASRGPGADSDSNLSSGEPTVDRTGKTRGDTCHLGVVDRWGNLVSVTPSGGWLQSSPTIPELGFCLGTRLQMTWLDPRSPSALRPGMRPRTTLTPTLLLRDGKAFSTLGSPGGDQQDQWQLPYLLRTIVGGYSPQEAIDAPTLHSTSFPDSFWPRHWEPGGAVVEGRLGEDLVSELRDRGHEVTVAGDWALGRLSAVGIEPDGSYFAAANPRGMQGYAAGR